MRKLNVLIICPFFRPNVGGVETHLDDLCEYLRTHDYKVYVLTYQPLTTKARGLKIEKKENLEIRRIWWPGFNLFHKLEPYPILEILYLAPRLLWATFWFLLFHQNKIDVIHAHGFIASLITRLVNVFFRKRTIMSTHAIYDLERKPLMAKVVKWIMDKIDVIMPLAEKSKRELLVVGVREEKIKIYTQWVSQSIFKPKNKADSRRKLGLNGNFFALFIGRLIEKKGAGVLLKVAEKLPEIKFVFVGDGPMLGELEIAGKQLKNVYVVGRKNQQEIALYYGAADVIIIPSQYEEGFARVVIESLYSGRPVIAANKGCLPEMLNSEVSILLDPTSHNITKTLCFLYKNSKYLERLTENARPYALRCFSERNAQEIATTYNPSSTENGIL
jgi:glycosyltransferase involved in cell wall biosynthesis